MRVAVVGCGAMGAATGWRLQKRGAEVVCFDRYSPPHDLGSTHGESRVTRTAYFEGPWYVPLLQETFGMWRELEAESKQQLLTLTGLLMIGAPDSEAIVASQAAAKEHGLEIKVLDASELRRRYPGHIVGDGEVAVLDPQAGFLRAEAAVSAMTRELNVRRNTQVTRVEPRSGGVEVATAQGTEDERARAFSSAQSRAAGAGVACDPVGRRRVQPRPLPGVDSRGDAAGRRLWTAHPGRPDDQTGPASRRRDGRSGHRAPGRDRRRPRPAAPFCDEVSPRRDAARDTQRRVPVHQHAGPAFRDRPAPRVGARGDPERVLGSWLQVLARRGRHRGRPRARRRHAARHLAPGAAAIYLAVDLPLKYQRTTTTATSTAIAIAASWMGPLTRS